MFMNLFSFFLFFNALSQQKIDTFSNGKPIEIFADKGIEWHKNDKKYIANGNAKAIQEDFIVTSDTMLKVTGINKNVKFLTMGKYTVNVYPKLKPHPEKKIK